VILIEGVTEDQCGRAGIGRGCCGIIQFMPGRVRMAFILPKKEDAKIWSYVRCENNDIYVVDNPMQNLPRGASANSHHIKQVQTKYAVTDTLRETSKICLVRFS